MNEEQFRAFWKSLPARKRQIVWCFIHYSRMTNEMISQELGMKAKTLSAHVTLIHALGEFDDRHDLFEQIHEYLQDVEFPKYVKRSRKIHMH